MRNGHSSRKQRKDSNARGQHNTPLIHDNIYPLKAASIRSPITYALCLNRVRDSELVRQTRYHSLSMIDKNTSHSNDESVNDDKIHYKIDFERSLQNK